MTVLDASGVDFKKLNEQVKDADEIKIENCEGQRFICAGAANKVVTITGTPGNALGCYLNGATIRVDGNAQDAVGDTMNDGKIVIRGRAGDALGYAMRGGKIYVLGDSGYRTGIHMKQYKAHKPVIIVGGAAGSFLGEYQAGGLIAVLNLNNSPRAVGNFTGTGIHGGKIFLRANALPPDLPAQVSPAPATTEDLDELSPYITDYANEFNLNPNDILSAPFYTLKPNSKNPYKQLYTSHS